MADKIKRVLLLFWHMIWPLLLYEATGTLVRSELTLLFPEKEPEQLALPAMGVTAAAACVFLGKLYQEGLFLAVCLVGGSWSRELPFI